MTVAELQAKSTPDEQASVSAIQARAAIEARTPPNGQPVTMAAAVWAKEVSDRPAGGQPEMTTELVKYEDVADERSTTNRLAKTIVVTLVAMVACGAVTAVAAMTGGRPHRLSPSAPIVQPAMTAGPAVVRPDAMIDQLVSGSLGRISAEPVGVVDQQSLVADRGAAERVVTQFYGALPIHSDEAYQLLGPDMKGLDWSEFNAGWRGTRSVEARVLRPNEQDGGQLRVAVSVEQFDGSVLQLLQRVEVRTVPVEGGPPALRIVGVQLLSAHRG